LDNSCLAGPGQLPPSPIPAASPAAPAPRADGRQPDFGGGAPLPRPGGGGAGEGRLWQRGLLSHIRCAAEVCGHHQGEEEESGGIAGGPVLLYLLQNTIGLGENF